MFSKLFNSSSRSSATRTESTRTTSANQASNTAPQTSASATLPVPSASNRNVSASKSKKERSGFLTFLHRGKNNRAKSKTVLTDGKWHVQSPWVNKDGNVTLNAKIFEESVLDSIQMGASDNRSWATRTKDMNNVLAKLKMLKPDQFDSLSAKDKAAVVDIFRHILHDIRKQQSQIGEIFREKEAASSSSKIKEENAIPDEIKKAKEALDAMGEHVEMLFPVFSIAKRLREQARHMHELDSSHEAIQQSNEKEYLGGMEKFFGKGKRVETRAEEMLRALSEVTPTIIERSVLPLQMRTKLQKVFVQAKLEALQPLDAEEHAIWEKKLMAQYKERIEISSFTDILNEAEMEGIELVGALSRDEFAFLTREMDMEKKKSDSNSSQTDEKTNLRDKIQKAENATLDNLHLSAKREGSNWGKKLVEQNEDRVKVSYQITDLFSEAAREGIDLSNELSTDEIVYLTRAMSGGASRDERGLITGRYKKAIWINEDGKKEEKTVKEVTKRETDKMAMQNADLLHESQLQTLLTRLDEQQVHLFQLNQLIQHSLQPGSTEVLSERADDIHHALARIDKEEISRLCKHNEAKGPKAKSRINEQLDLIGERIKTLDNAILHTLGAAETSTNILPDTDKRQLNQAAKSLKYAQNEVDALQGKFEIQAAAPSSQQ